MTITNWTRKVFISWISRNNHTVKDPIMCPECEKWFKTDTTLKYHLINVHKVTVKKKESPIVKLFSNLDGDYFKCKLCGKKVKATKRDGIYALKRHFNEWHVEKDKFVCDECGKKFRAKRFMSQHKRNFHNNNNILK